MPQQISQIMTANPSTCRLNDSVMKALDVMKSENCGAVPVMDTNNNLVNMVTDRDIALCMLNTDKHPKDITIQDCVGQSRKMVTVTPQDKLQKAVELMERNQVRRLPVVNEQGRLEGIVAQADISLKAENPREIAELVQEISKERQSLGANP